MLTEHSKFIETASADELQRVRTDLEKLFPVLREADVRAQTRTLLRAIDQEMLERVMRQHRLAQSTPVVALKAKAA